MSLRETDRADELLTVDQALDDDEAYGYFADSEADATDEEASLEQTCEATADNSAELATFLKRYIPESRDPQGHFLQLPSSMLTAVGADLVGARLVSPVLLGHSAEDDSYVVRRTNIPDKVSGAVRTLIAGLEFKAE